jgi:hypothetical protein
MAKTRDKADQVNARQRHGPLGKPALAFEGNAFCPCGYAYAA